MVFGHTLQQSAGQQEMSTTQSDPVVTTPASVLTLSSTERMSEVGSTRWTCPPHERPRALDRDVIGGQLERTLGDHHRPVGP
ncbi:MAG: hypothetical protein U0231_16885 [Nitrospiraceae bacterium]